MLPTTYALPTTAIGRITTRAGAPRIIELGVKYGF